MISNILFDLDGTLTDPKEGITRSIQFALNQLRMKPPPADRLTWCIGPSLKGSFSQLLNTRDDTVLDQALFYYRKRFSERGIYENVVYPEVESSLGRIRKAGFRIFLATSKPRVFAKRILEHFDLTRYFQAVYGSQLSGRLTDKGELIAHILDFESLNPKETLMVGDRSYDIIGGKSNGVMTAAVSYGYGSREELTLLKPDIVVGTLSDLASFLESKATPATSDWIVPL
ncbi:MAG: HAD hydrolase-like protein [Proteobacteria bacterium]|nr:HAD hydrolase-like protein [Pseudomonadota bacterium]